MDTRDLAVILLTQDLLLISLFGFFYFLYRKFLLPKVAPAPTGKAAFQEAIKLKLLKAMITRASASLKERTDSGEIDIETQIGFQNRLQLLEWELALSNATLSEADYTANLRAQVVKSMGLSKAGEQSEAVDVGEVEQLRKELALYKIRTESLEKFKKIFFDTKKQMDAYEEINAALTEKILKECGGVNDNADLKSLLERVDHEKSIVQEQLKIIQSDFNALFDSLGQLPVTGLPAEGICIENINSAADNFKEGLGALKDIIDKQSSKINSLTAMLDELKISAEEASRLKQLLQEVEESKQSLLSVVEVLQDENEFMQAQIAQLLKDSRECDEKLLANHPEEERFVTLEQTLREQQEKIAELTQANAELEREYLKIYEQVHGQNTGE